MSLLATFGIALSVYKLISAHSRNDVRRLGAIAFGRFSVASAMLAGLVVTASG